MEAFAVIRAKRSPEELTLKQELERAERYATQSVLSFKNKDWKDEEAKRAGRLKLQKAVRKVFELRMQLQHVQLDDAEVKLKDSRERLVRRQSLAKKIVERRVADLLKSAETEWGSTPEKVAETQHSISSRLSQMDRENPSLITKAKSTNPASEVLPGLKDLPGINPSKSSQSILDARVRNESSFDSLMLRDGGPTTHDRSEALLDQADARKIAQDFLYNVSGNQIEEANKLAESPKISKFVRSVLYPKLIMGSPPMVNKCVVKDNVARATTGTFKLREADPNPGPEEAYLVVRMRKFSDDDPFSNTGEVWRVVEVGLGNIADSKTEKPKTSASSEQINYRQLLGNWEVISVEGKVGRFMTLDASTKVGDILVIPHVLAPINNKRLDRSKIYKKSPFERRWFSEELKTSWSKDDSLHLYPGTDPARMTYRGKDGKKNHFADSADPAEFAIYRVDGDEMTLMVGDPYDFKINQGQDTNKASDGSPVHWSWRLVIPNYPKDFNLDPADRQLLVKLRRVPSKTTPLALVKPQRTRFGLVYRNEKESYREAIAVSAVGNLGRVMLVHGRPGKTSESSFPAIQATQVKITVPGDPNSLTFVLPAADADKDGDASLFELKSPQLVNAMKSGSYTVSFEVDGRRQEYEVYQHPEAPLVPRLQLMKVYEFDTDDQQRKTIALASGWEVLPRASRVVRESDQQPTEVMTRKLTSAIVNENDVLSAVAKPSEATRGGDDFGGGADFSDGPYEVSVKLTPVAAKRMSAATKQMLKQNEEDEEDLLRLAILVDGEVIMVARLNSILSNSIVITGDFTESEAKQLAESISKESR